MSCPFNGVEELVSNLILDGVSVPGQSERMAWWVEKRVPKFTKISHLNCNNSFSYMYLDACLNWWNKQSHHEMSTNLHRWWSTTNRTHQDHVWQDSWFQSRHPKRWWLLVANWPFPSPAETQRKFRNWNSLDTTNVENHCMSSISRLISSIYSH